MNLEELAKKHANDFPGYELVDNYEAGFPSYVLQLEVLLQIKRPVPVLEEFILKAVEAGQTRVKDIADLLGLDHPIVEYGLDQLQLGNYVYFHLNPKNKNTIIVNITDKGRTALRELYLSEPEPDNFSVCMDALTGLLYPREPLRQAKVIRDQGYHEIPTLARQPSLEQLDLTTLKRLWAREQESQLQKEGSIRSEQRELVELRAIEKTWTEYRLMRVLQYLRPDDGALMVQVFYRGDHMDAHDVALLNMENDKRRPLRAVLERDMPPKDEDIFTVIGQQKIEAARRNRSEIPLIQTEVANRQQVVKQTEEQEKSDLVDERREARYIVEEQRREIERLRDQIQTMQDQAGGTEALQMHEHRSKLFEALSSSKQQVIIISPWLNNEAVDNELQIAIGEALNRGVNILIGYGLGEPNRREEHIVRKLKELRKGKTGKLCLYRMRDIHSKVLICDDSFMVLTSFNWLSFAGDRNRGSRVEDGILTRDKSVIESKKNEWLDRLKNAPGVI